MNAPQGQLNPQNGASTLTKAPSTPTPAPATQSLRLPQPPSSILIGPSGSGKSTALATYAKAGIETFVIITEPGGLDSLLDAAALTGAPMDKLHWATCMPITEGWDALKTMTSDIGSKDYEGLSKLKGIGKDKTRQGAMRLLEVMQDFPCERTGKHFGSFTSFSNKQAFCIDSLSGVNLIAWYLTVGYKPTAAPGEWNIAQNWIEAVLNKINTDRQCYFTMTAHLEKEQDEITGVNKLMVSTLGRKLAPKIPRFFGEVVFTERKVDPKDNKPTFRWSTIESQVDLKNRALPISNQLAPDFQQVVSAYEARLKKAGIGTPA